MCIRDRIKIVLEETELESYVKGADVVVTGEGRLDFQTAMGKAPVGVAGLAKKFDIPVPVSYTHLICPCRIEF